MRTVYCCLLSCLFSLGAFAQGATVIPGHAHNDYEHRRPLFEALEHGFTSVEVDVHLVGDRLFVAHDRPVVLDPTLTLDALYLKPLQEWIDTHGGRVYPGFDETFYLMIDIKTAAEPTYARIRAALRDYAPVFSNGRPEAGIASAVTILLSGNRPVERVLLDSSRLVLLDGRPAELARKVSTSQMPIVSENCRNILYWDGRGEPSGQDRRRLRALVAQTHRQGKLLRLWAAPDHPKAWAFLLENGVDLINTDHIAEFRAFHQAYAREERE